MIRVLFICTHNSARSQMAEALANSLHSNILRAWSAGTELGSLNQDAVKAMSEIDIDISQYRSKNMNEFKGQSFDFVVTLCDSAAESCPFFPGGEILHRPFPDPSTAEDGLATARRARDLISKFIDEDLVPLAMGLTQ